MHQTKSYTSNRTLLKAFIEAETEPLLGTLRYYLMRAGLANGPGASAAATELLNEVVVEALEHADRFRPEGQPRAWLLGIAANLIKRKQAERAVRNRREPLVQDLYPDRQNSLSEEELFDRVAALSQAGPAQALAANEGAAAILALVPDGDRRVLQLAVLHGMDGSELARELEITPGAARVRLHRALKRLRNAWQEQERQRVEDYG